MLILNSRRFFAIASAVCLPIIFYVFCSYVFSCEHKVHCDSHCPIAPIFGVGGMDAVREECGQFTEEGCYTGMVDLSVKWGQFGKKEAPESNKKAGNKPETYADCFTYSSCHWVEGECTIEQTGKLQKECQMVTYDCP